MADANRRARIEIVGDARSFITSINNSVRSVERFSAALATTGATTAIGGAEAAQARARFDAAMAKSLQRLSSESVKTQKSVQAVGAATQTATKKGVQGWTAYTEEMDRARRATEQHNLQQGRLVRGALAGAGAFTSLGRSIAYASASFLAFAVLSGAFRTSVAAAAQFQHTLNTIVGLAGGVREQIGGISSELLRLAPIVGQTPQQLADALYFVASAGIGAAKGVAAIGDQMKVVIVSAKAAAAGLGDTATVADAVTSAMNSYGEANLSAAHATDVLVNTVRFGKGEASTFAPVIGQVASQAAELGVSFEEVGAALATMTTFGTDASTAAIQLQGVFKALLNPGKQGEEILLRLGTSSKALTDQLAQHGLLSVLATLKVAFKGNDQEARQFFGDIRAFRGVVQLVGQNIESTIRIFDAMKDSTGALAVAFGAVSKDPVQRFRAFQAAMQALQITIGSALLPVVIDLTDALTKLFQDPERLQTIKDSVQGIAEAFKDVFVTIKNIITPFYVLSNALAQGIGGWGNMLKAVIAAWAVFRISAIANMNRVRVVNGQAIAYTYRSAIAAGLAWVKSSFQAEMAMRRLNTNTSGIFARMSATIRGTARQMTLFEAAPRRRFPELPALFRRPPRPESAGQAEPTAFSQLLGLSRRVGGQMQRVATASRSAANATVVAWTRAGAASAAAAARSSAAWTAASARSAMAWVRNLRVIQGASQAVSAQLTFMPAKVEMAWIRSSGVIGSRWIATYLEMFAATFVFLNASLRAAGVAARGWIASFAMTTTASLRSSVAMQIHWFRVGRRMGGFSTAFAYTTIGNFILVQTAAVKSATATAIAWARSFTTTTAASLRSALQMQVHWFRVGLRMGGISRAVSMTWIGNMQLMAQATAANASAAAASAVQAWRGFAVRVRAALSSISAASVGAALARTWTAAAAAASAAWQAFAVRVRVAFATINASSVAAAVSRAWRASATASLLAWRNFARGAQASARATAVVISVSARAAGLAIKAALISTGIGILFVALGELITQVILHWKEIAVVAQRSWGTIKAGMLATLDVLKGAVKVWAGTVTTWLLFPVRLLLEAFSRLPFGIGDKFKGALDAVKGASTGLIQSGLDDIRGAANRFGTEAARSFGEAFRDTLFRIFGDMIQTIKRQLDAIEVVRGPRFRQTGVFIPTLTPGTSVAEAPEMKQLQLAEARAFATQGPREQLAVEKRIRDFLKGLLKAGTLTDDQKTEAFNSLREAKDKIASLMKGVGDSFDLSGTLRGTRLLFNQAKAQAQGTRQAQLQAATAIRDYIQGVIDAGKGGLKFLTSAFQAMKQIQSEIDQLSTADLVPEPLQLAEAKAAALGTEKEQKAIAARIAEVIKATIASGKLHGQALIDAYNQLAHYREAAGKKESDAVKEHARLLKEATDRIASAIDDARSQIGELFKGPLLQPSQAMQQFGLGLPAPDIGQLTADLNAQVALRTRLEKDLMKLAKRGAPDELIQELRGQGVDALPVIQEILKGGRTELRKLFAAFRGRERLAAKVALIELRSERVNLTARNIALRMTPNQLRRFNEGGALPPIRINLFIDGKHVTEVVTTRQQRNGRGSGNQRRGQQAGRR